MALAFVGPTVSDAALTLGAYNYLGKASCVLIRYTNGNSFHFPPIHLFGGTIQKTVRTERIPPCHIPPVWKFNGGNLAALSTVTPVSWNFARKRFKRLRECQIDWKETTYTSCSLFSSVFLYTGIANRGTALADN